MLRVLLIILMLLLSVPLLNKASDYAENKFNQAKIFGEKIAESIKEFFKKSDSEANDEDKKIRSDPPETKDLTH